MLAFTVLTIAIGGVTSMLVQTQSLRDGTREAILASNAARSVIEQLKGETFEEVYALYNSDPTDDPGGDGSAPGNTFPVLGLDPRPGDPDGIVGQIIFPGNGVELRENLVDPVLSTPRDLNADGVIDAADHASDYVILPVRVRIEWAGEAGTRTAEFMTALVNV
jgi:hypothetical protein